MPPVVEGATAEPVTHRNWTDEWVLVRCGACGREDEWPHPELGCTCGTVLRVPVHPPHGDGPDAAHGFGADGPDPADTRTTGPRPDPEAAAGPERQAAGHGDAASGAADAGRGGVAAAVGAGGEVLLGGGAPADRRGEGRDGAAVPPAQEAPLWESTGQGRGRRSVPIVAEGRGAFRPVTIRTARDAVAAAAGYLRWLGFRDVVQPEERSASGADLRAPGLVAQVDPSTRPATLRAVECLWLNGLSNAAVSVFFSLAGYTPEARARADGLGVPLFVLDLTGTPQAVNTHAEELITATAR
ncbi:hypothetical protein [Streptomyces sp. NPDC008121]|uniref:hypothetical protein n=1 Tax=Streptomyces sp. NPDC008121 TaxID=3364809 RepID=UPI0036E3D92D